MIADEAIGRHVAARSHLTGLLITATSQAVFGSMGFFYKTALAGGASTLTILALRFPLAALPLWGFIFLTGRRARLTRRRVLGLVLMGGGFYVGQSYLFLAALEYIPLSTAVLLQMVHPVLVVILAILTGRERPTSSRLLAMALAISGGALIVGGPGETADLRGIALAIASPVVYSVYILLGDRLMQGVDPLVASAYITSSAGVGFIALALAFGSLSLTMTSQAWIAILIVAWFCTVVGVTGFLAGLPRIGPSAASIIGMLEPAVGVALGVLVLGELLTPGLALGGACIVLAVVLLRSPAHRPVRAEAAAVAAGPRSTRPG